MGGTEPNAVVKEIFIDAPPEAVFPFLIDPSLLVQWLGEVAELEPRAGGLFRVDVNRRDVVRGQYLEVDPPRRVIFSWGWDRPDSSTPPGSSIVEITLMAEGAGTRVRLIHRDLPDDVRRDHSLGWDHYLERLRVVGTGGDPGPDRLAGLEIEHGAPGSFPGQAAGGEADPKGDQD